MTNTNPIIIPNRRNFRTQFFFIFLAVLLASAFSNALAEEEIKGIGGGVNTGLPVLTITAGSGAVRAELASIPSARQVGLSGRRTLAADGGMLLMLPNPQQMCLWMRQVYFPLDAAFIDAGGTVVGTAKMLEHTENIHCPPKPICYALEVAAGWLEKHQVTVGTQLPDFAHRPKTETDSISTEIVQPPICGGGINITAE